MKSTVGEKCDMLKQERESVSEEPVDDEEETEGEEEYTAGRSRTAMARDQKLQEFDQKLADAQDELHMLSYHLNILQEDFHLELTIRPEMIRYIGSVQDQMSELEDSLNEKKSEKSRSERKLTLMKTNCEKMKRAMSKYMLQRESAIVIKEKKPSSEMSTKSRAENENSNNNNGNFDNEDDSLDQTYNIPNINQLHSHSKIPALSRSLVEDNGYDNEPEYSKNTPDIKRFTRIPRLAKKKLK